MLGELDSNLISPPVMPGGPRAGLALGHPSIGSVGKGRNLGMCVFEDGLLIWLTVKKDRHQLKS